MTTALLATATTPDLITFIVSGVIIIAGALGVVASRNPVHAALSLVMTLFGVAVLFLEQGADFLAAVQIIVYAGAIVVLFLFVIMFLGVDRREDVDREPLRGQRPLAFAMVGIMLASVIVLIANSHWVSGAPHVVGPINGRITRSPGAAHGEVAQLGKQLFTTYLFAFEVTAALLVIAVVSAVVLARRPANPFDDEEPETGIFTVDGPEMGGRPVQADSATTTMATDQSVGSDEASAENREVTS
jgi:NADH-quinone oxidoreductase subunit J